MARRRQCNKSGMRELGTSVLLGFALRIGVDIAEDVYPKIKKLLVNQFSNTSKPATSSSKASSTSDEEDDEIDIYDLDDFTELITEDTEEDVAAPEEDNDNEQS